MCGLLALMRHNVTEIVQVLKAYIFNSSGTSCKLLLVAVAVAPLNVQFTAFQLVLHPEP